MFDNTVCTMKKENFTSWDWNFTQKKGIQFSLGIVWCCE